MFEKVKKFCIEHQTEILVGIYAAGFLVEVAAIAYAVGAVDGMRAARPGLPRELAVRAFEENGQRFLSINGVVYSKG